MAKSDHDGERKLLDAGKAILAEEGFGGLSVRAVAARAGVNLGLVSYHFGGKEAFVRRVAQEVYEDFFRDFSLEARAGTDPLAALRSALLRLVRFIRDHRRMVAGILLDLAQGDPEAVRFVRLNGPRHGRIVAGLLRRCMKVGYLKKRSLMGTAAFVMGASVGPILMAESIVKKIGPKLPFAVTRRLIESELLSDGSVEERVDMVLKALQVDSAPSRRKVPLKRNLFAGLLLALPALGCAVSLRLSLERSVDLALKSSHSLQAARLEAEAAQARVKAALGAALPRLSLDGQWRWVQEIPTVKLSPAAPPAKFGDNNNYSLGVSVTWDLFGALASWRSLQMAQAAAEAKAAEAALQERALRLRTRLAYFQTQLAATKVRLLAQSLLLAQSQEQDLQLRLKAGSSSRIDALSASNEELDRRAQFRLAQADLAAALRELFALSGEGAGADLSLPMVDGDGRSLPARVEAPSLLVELDPTEQLLDSLRAAGSAPFDPDAHPQRLVLQALVEAARRQADLAYAGHWPRGGVSARRSVDYPNGPVLEQVRQSALGANLSIPLYSFGSVSAQVDEGVALAKAAEERRQAAVTELSRDWAKARDRLAALQVERELLKQRALQTEDLQQLVYKAYKIGGANYLEVQNSSLRALQAGLDLARTETQMLIELANLSALSKADR